MVEQAENELRDMLRRRAADFSIEPVSPADLLHRATRRRTRNIVLSTTAALAVIALVAGAVSAVRGMHDSGVAPSSQSRVGTGSPTATGRLRLVDYTLRTSRETPHAGSGPEITIEDVRRHGECMRAQGFNVPAPTRRPGGGWSVIVEDPERSGLSLSSPAFRRAWLVTCGPLGGPISGDIVLSGSRSKIDQFISCMSGQGFQLPSPKSSGRGGEWQFDLTGTDIDTSTRAWNEAMFVTCAPEDL